MHPSSAYTPQSESADELCGIKLDYFCLHDLNPGCIYIHINTQYATLKKNFFISSQEWDLTVVSLRILFLFIYQLLKKSMAAKLKQNIQFLY